MINRTLLSCLTLSLTLLTGCSGHPSAGKWTSTENVASPFSHVQIDFDGKAAIHPRDKKGPTLNCYWQATSANQVDIQCGNAEQEEGNIFYTFEVSSDQTLATLSFEEQPIGQFKRLP